MLKQVVLGIVPLSLAILISEIIVGKDTDWRAHGPEPVSVEEGRFG